MKRVLITGGGGGIAQAIKEKMTAAGGYDVRTPGRSELNVTDIAGVDKYMAE